MYLLQLIYIINKIMCINVTILSMSEYKKIINIRREKSCEVSMQYKNRLSICK